MNTGSVKLSPMTDEMYHGFSGNSRMTLTCICPASLMFIIFKAKKKLISIFRGSMVSDG